MVIGPEDPNFRKDNRDVILKRKQQHDLWVQTKCPKEKLLTYRIGEGWEPICKFLNKPGTVLIIFGCTVLSTSHATSSDFLTQSISFLSFGKNYMKSKWVVCGMN